MKKQGQSILEYAVLVAVVLSAWLIMQVFVKRAYQGRLKHEADSIGTQYSPRHQTAYSSTTTFSNSISYTGGNTSTVDAPELINDNVAVDEGMSVTVTKSYSNSTSMEKTDDLGAEKLYEKP